jgi:hypothetical protein
MGGILFSDCVIRRLMYDKLISFRENFCKALIFFEKRLTASRNSRANDGFSMIQLKNLPSIRKLGGALLAAP